jgi:hypothetical protein
MAGENTDVKNEQSARRTYEPPAIEQTSEFETLALTCALGPNGGGDCSVGPNGPGEPTC